MDKLRGSILALDIASTTGWAWGKPGNIPKFGHHRFKQPGEERAVAYRAFRLWLDLFLSAHKTALVVYESPATPMLVHGRSNIGTIRFLVGMAEMLEEWSYKRFELREASTQEVRAHFIGRNYKSAIAKPMVVERCRSFGWLVENPDQADACALWDYMCCIRDPEMAARQTPLFSGIPSVV